MEVGQMMQKLRFDGEGFNVMMKFGAWRIGFIKYAERFSKVVYLERHLETDETFVLLDGEATLHTADEEVKMEKCMIYNIPKGEWHHITVTDDATVMVVENSDTSPENTEKRHI